MNVRINVGEGVPCLTSAVREFLVLASRSCARKVLPSSLVVSSLRNSS